MKTHFGISLNNPENSTILHGDTKKTELIKLNTYHVEYMMIRILIFVTRSKNLEHQDFLFIR